MKILRISTIFPLFLLISCISLILSGCASQSTEKKTLPDFIIGRWIGKFSEVKNGIKYEEIYQLEFIEPNKLIYSGIMLDNSIYNMVFSYNFVQQNQIEVRARLVDNWVLSQENDNLIIRSNEDLLRNGPYERVPIVNWGVFTITFTGLIIILVVLCLRRFFNDRTRKTNKSISQNGYFANFNFSLKILFILANVSLLIAGVILTIGFWNSFAIRSIIFPWDGLFSVDVGVILLLVGIIMVIRCQSKRLSLPTFITLTFIGVLVIGSSIDGLVTGILRIILFLSFGYYPPSEGKLRFDFL